MATCDMMTHAPWPLGLAAQPPFGGGCGDTCEHAGPEGVDVWPNPGACGGRGPGPWADSDATVPPQGHQQYLQALSCSTTEAAIEQATGTRPSPGGSPDVPTLTEVWGIRRFLFRIESADPKLQRAVQAEREVLRRTHPDYLLDVLFNVTHIERIP